ncbi:MAG: O-antigen ligase family protein, partial [Pseudomonadota bacterium]
LVIDLFIVGTWFGVEKVVARIEQSSMSHDADRIEVSRSTLNLLKDYPIVGSGGGSFHAVYPRYRPETIVSYYDHTHEDYLELAADTGLVGLGLLGLLVVMSLWVALTALYRRRDPLMRGMAFASVMGTIALLIHSTVDFNLQIPANAALFMVILALGWIALYLDRQPGNRHGSN